jgi:hypothetical protein
MRPGISKVCAFSLVELLVVISVIALLMALILPSFKKAREQSRRVVCASHLRGLSNSWELYTIEFGTPPYLARRGVDVNGSCVSGCSPYCEWEPIHVGGFGPDYFDVYLALNCDDQVWLSALHHRFHLFQVSNPPPSGPLPGHWWNFGLMWLSGIVQDPQAFFCPSVRDPDFGWDTPLNPWPPTFETMWRPDRPWQVNHTQAGYERRIGLSALIWDRIPSQTTIAHDIAAPNVDRISHCDGSNVAYRDGHVTYVRGEPFSTWWEDDDSWYNETTRRKLLAFSYWMDQGGGSWPVEQAP